MDDDGFGDMPNDSLLLKLEESNPQYNSAELDVENYIKSEMIDRGPDNVMHESDRTVYNPSTSKSIINIHYNGTRDGNPELPRHPEMFYGFTGRDPRGTSDDPRLDLMRGQIAKRTRDMTVRMGDNDDYAIAERPWTDQSISYARKDMMQRTKVNLKVFEPEREGFVSGGNNFVANTDTNGNIRKTLLDSSFEGFDFKVYNYRDNHDGPATSIFAGGDQGSLNGEIINKARGTVRRAKKTPWETVVNDTDLGVQDYSHARSTKAPSHFESRGETHQDQDMAVSITNSNANRNILAATMAIAVKNVKHNRSAQNEHDHGVSLENDALKISKTADYDSIAAVYKTSGETGWAKSIDNAHGPRNGGTKFAPDLSNAKYKSTSHITNNAYITNVGNIVNGLRSNLPSDRNRISMLVEADGKREGREFVGQSIGGGMVKKNRQNMTNASSMDLPVSSTGEMSIHNYTNTAPKDNRKTQHGINGSTAEFGASINNKNISTKRPEYHGNTQTSGRVQGDRRFTEHVTTNNRTVGKMNKSSNVYSGSMEDGLSDRGGFAD